MGFAFERKPSGSLLTSGGAKNLRQRRIPLFLRQEERNSNRVAFLVFYILIFLDFYGIILLSNSKVLNVFGALRR